MHHIHTAIDKHIEHILFRVLQLYEYPIVILVQLVSYRFQIFSKLMIEFQAVNKSKY